MDASSSSSYHHVVSARNTTLERFGKNVRMLRESKNWSQEEFAARVGLDRTYIGGIERGERNVGLINVCRIARTLNVTASILLEGVEGDASNGSIA